MSAPPRGSRHPPRGTFGARSRRHARRGFQLAGAALKYRHPEQYDYVFHDLAPARGAEAVLTVGTFLKRLDDLEKSPERKATRKADHAALETLARRRIDAQERARLQALVDVAQEVVAAGPDDNQERVANLLALYRWLDEWVETAKAIITRRDYLIALGIVKRRPKKKPAAKPAPSDGTRRDHATVVTGRSAACCRATCCRAARRGVARYAGAYGRTACCRAACGHERRRPCCAGLACALAFVIGVPIATGQETTLRG